MTLAPYLVLFVAIIIVALMALHAMTGVRENADAIARIERRGDRRWMSQNAVNNAAASDIGRLKAKVQFIERRMTDDGK